MKPMRSLVFAVLLALPVAGCGDDIFGLTDGGTNDMTVVVYKLVSGDYTVTKLTDKMDGCMIDDPNDPVLGAKFAVTNDGQGNVNLTGWGMGQVLFNKGTLKLMGKYGPVNMCEYNYDVTVDVTVTADNTFTGKYTEKHTGRTSQCFPMVGAACTSSWTMELKKP
jgi:hypothetical protein